MKHTIHKSFLIPFATAALFLGACGTATSDSSELPVNDGSSELPVNDGPEPAAEQPILEPGDELIYSTNPTNQPNRLGGFLKQSRSTYDAPPLEMPH